VSRPQVRPAERFPSVSRGNPPGALSPVASRIQEILHPCNTTRKRPHDTLARVRRKTFTPEVRQTVSALMQEHGLTRTVWVLQFAAAWLLAVRDNDWQPIDAEQYAAYWKKGRAQGYRDQRKWRETFPQEPTPNERVIAARPLYEQLVGELAHTPSQDELAVALSTILV